MFDYIVGIISDVTSKYIVIENNDIGYIIHTSNPYNFNKGIKEKIYIYSHIKEDCFDLYGFKTRDERELFIKMLSVKGIGPKSALAIVASGNVIQLENAIANGDASFFARLPGIGVKASNQIILDLKGKLNNERISVLDPKAKDVMDALKSLGYSSTEIKKVEGYIMSNLDLPIGELVRLSLKKML